MAKSTLRIKFNPEKDFSVLATATLNLPGIVPGNGDNQGIHFADDADNVKCAIEYETYPTELTCIKQSSSLMTVQFQGFHLQAKDYDLVIYNATVNPSSLADLDEPLSMTIRDKAGNGSPSTVTISSLSPYALAKSNIDLVSVSIPDSLKDIDWGNLNSFSG